MPTCRKCSAAFPNMVKIDGVTKNLCSRRYCLDCSPWGLHNTKILDSTENKRKRPRPPRKSSSVREASHKGIKERAVQYKGGKCLHCGYDRSVWAMDFHHRDPLVKDFRIGYGTKAWAKIQTELDKCDLLCRNCHFEEHERFPLLEQPQVFPAGSGDLRPCSRCHNPTPPEGFYTSHGREYRECKGCFRKRMNDRHLARRILLVQENGGACKVCGYNRSLNALSFHHRDPATKDFGMGQRPSAPLNLLRIECQKCDLLCGNCHAEEHERLFLAGGPRGI